MTWREAGTEGTIVRQIIDRWWVVAAIALVGAIAGYWLPQLNPPIYQSTSAFVIATGDSIEDSGDVAAALGVLRNRQVTATFAEILQSQTLLDRATTEIGSAGSAFESTGVVLPESNVVSLTVSGPDADAVREVNQIIGAAGSEDLASLYPIYRAILLESAKTPSAPASPVPVRDALFGAAVGAFLGIVLAVVWPVPKPNRQTPPIIGIKTARIQERAEAGGES
jgi:capsular polysaccharide biosynthesis protein